MAAGHPERQAHACRSAQRARRSRAAAAAAQVVVVPPTWRPRPACRRRAGRCACSPRRSRSWQGEGPGRQGSAGQAGVQALWGGAGQKSSRGLECTGGGSQAGNVRRSCQAAAGGRLGTGRALRAAVGAARTCGAPPRRPPGARAPAGGRGRGPPVVGGWEDRKGAEEGGQAWRGALARHRQGGSRKSNRHPAEPPAPQPPPAGHLCGAARLRLQRGLLLPQLLGLAGGLGAAGGRGGGSGVTQGGTGVVGSMWAAGRGSKQAAEAAAGMMQAGIWP